MNSKKIVFFGTPSFAAEVLLYLLQQKVEIVAVVTQPDKPKGRSLQMAPSAVKEALLSQAPHTPLFQPEKASNPQFLDELRNLRADLYVVVAYGQILTQTLLDIPPLGCINIHASLLPKLRGAAPIQRAILEGETETGIAIQKMVRQLDAGDVLSVAKMAIPIDMTYGVLEQRLCELAKPLLLDLLKTYETGIPHGIPQNSEQVTYASKIELAEGEIDWKKPSAQIHNLIRAFSPRPGAWCWIQAGPEKKRLKIFFSELANGKGAPGELLNPQGIVACGEGAIKLLEVQPEGKKAMKAADWLRGQKNISFICN